MLNNFNKTATTTMLIRSGCQRNRRTRRAGEKCIGMKRCMKRNNVCYRVCDVDLLSLV